MQLSIVIPLHHSVAHLPRLVGRLSTTVPEAELVFVDDASGDGTLELARELAAVNFPEASQVVALPKNFGFIGARRAGVEAARGEFVTLVDADDDWEDDYFLELLERLPESLADVILRPIKSRVPGAPQFHLVSGIWGRAIRREVALRTWALEAAYPSFVDNDNNLLWRLYDLAEQGVELLDGAAYIWDQNLASTRYQAQFRQGILQDKVQSICALEDWLKPVIAPDLWAVLLGRWAIELQANLFDAPSLQAVLTDPAGWHEFLANLRRDHPSATARATELIRAHFNKPQFQTDPPFQHLHLITACGRPEELPARAEQFSAGRSDMTWWCVVSEGAQPPMNLPLRYLFLPSTTDPFDLALEHIQDGHVVEWPIDATWRPDEIFEALRGRRFNAAAVDCQGVEVDVWSRSLIGCDRRGRGGVDLVFEEKMRDASRSRLLIRLQTKSESPPTT